MFMADFMQYAYVFLWIILAALTFVIGVRQGAVGFMLTGFFVFMAVWYGLRAFGGLNVFEGVWIIIFRCVMIAYLILTSAVWIRSKKKQDSENQSDEQ